MNYIIPITLTSLIVLFLTTIKREPVSAKGGAKPHIDRDAFTDIVRQVVIVFLSAMLAMWLTEYVENKTVKNRVQALTPQIQVSISSQTSQVGAEIKSAHESGETSDAAIRSQLRDIAKEIERDDMDLWEAMLYNESFLTTLDPMSYMHINIDFSQLRHTKNDLINTDFATADIEAVTDSIANYLYYCTDAAFCLSVLSEDIEFNLLALTMLEDEVFEKNIYYVNYNSCIDMLEEHFGTDMDEWKDKRQFGRTTVTREEFDEITAKYNEAQSQKEKLNNAA